MASTWETPCSHGCTGRTRNRDHLAVGLRSNAGPRPVGGFTLVELLVVIAIIAVLIGLLIPAVQAARESARRAVCISNLRQIGLGILGYANAKRNLLPYGSYHKYPIDPKNQRGSGLVLVLPWLEQQPIFDAIDLDNLAIPVDDMKFPGSSKFVRSAVIQILVCPSDSRPLVNVATQTAATNYTASSGPTAHADSPSCSCPTAMALNFYQIPDKYSQVNYYGQPSLHSGPFNRGGIAFKTSAIRDGLSKTIFFGEMRPECSVHHAQGWLLSNSGQGLTSTLVPINTNTCEVSSPDACKRPCNWNMELGFRSSHPGGAVFLLGDGSTHFFRETIDHQMYQLLGAKADGQSVTMP